MALDNAAAAVAVGCIYVYVCRTLKVWGEGIGVVFFLCDIFLQFCFVCDVLPRYLLVLSMYFLTMHSSIVSYAKQANIKRCARLDVFF